MVEGKIKLRGRSQMVDAVVNLREKTIAWNGQEFALDELALDSPVSGMVYGTLLNYKGALSVLGEAVFDTPYKNPPKAPILYIKPVNTLSSYGAPIPLPSGVEGLEVGAALGVVIGQTATRVSEGRALGYVAGYTVVNDVSIPHQSVYRPAIREKARDGFCPVGPWVIERKSVKNPNNLPIHVYVNGELRQENTTGNLIRTVEKLIADVTEFMTLFAGDVLLVGVPENPPLVTAGDRIRVEIDGVGVLENHIVHENEWMRGRTK